MIDILFFVGILLLGLVFGTLNEKRHYRSIEKREKESVNLPIVTFGKKAEMLGEINKSSLVCANVVISIDAFKKLIAGIIGLIGGSMFAYETLVDRARREAILRLKEACPDARIIINTRIETSSITKNTRQSVGAIEVLAYGTAIY